MAYTCGAIYSLFVVTHLRSSSTAMSCLTWWNSLAILQCSLYTWTLSLRDTQGGTGCKRSEREACEGGRIFSKTTTYYIKIIIIIKAEKMSETSKTSETSGTILACLTPEIKICQNSKVCSSINST